METPESIERMLERRLLPSALSPEGAAGLEALIDELQERSPVPSRDPGKRRIYAALAAAAVVLLSAVFVVRPGGDGVSAGVDELFGEPQQVVMLEDVEGVVSAEENGRLVADPDGSLHRAWHVQVMSEVLYHDERSGHEVRVVHPRDEIVLMPVSSF